MPLVHFTEAEEALLRQYHDPEGDFGSAGFTTEEPGVMVGEGNRYQFLEVNKYRRVGDIFFRVIAYKDYPRGEVLDGCAELEDALAEAVELGWLVHTPPKTPIPQAP